jgi:transposase InsO family protein
MEERKAIIRAHVSKGMKVDVAAKMAGMSKSTYYYSPRPGKRGRKPSIHCKTNNGLIVTNEQVVDQIRATLGQEFMENGYRKMTHELKDMAYIIGKTKTYRLMKENKLLLQKRKSGSRIYVRHTQPLPFEPFEKLEMDIKFIYIRGERKNALLLTILDTFTRIALAWVLQYSIKHSTVAMLMNEVIDIWLLDYRPPFDENISVTLRCDNDGRFVALDLQKYLKDNFIEQEFILPATPEQNAHIESFHSVVEQLVCQKYEFENIHQAYDTFTRFYDTYNNRRTISSLMYLPPKIFLEQWREGNIGMKLRKQNGRIKQSFFFRGQRPNWLSALPEEHYLISQNKNTTENTKFANHSLNES